MTKEATILLKKDRDVCHKVRATEGAERAAARRRRLCRSFFLPTRHARAPPPAGRAAGGCGEAARARRAARCGSWHPRPPPAPLPRPSTDPHGRRSRRRRQHHATPPLPRAPPQARDAFYQCVREQGFEYAPGGAIPDRCAKARAAFERGCPLSWVRHFDALQDRTARQSRALHANIKAGAATAAGGLAGKPQQ